MTNPRTEPRADGGRARPSVVMLVNGAATSAMGERASAFARRMEHEFRVVLAHREGSKVGAIGRMVATLARERPDVVYVVDIAYSGVLAAAAWRAVARVPVVVDTGDAITELAKAVGERGRAAMLATRALELLGVRIAAHVVARGTRHVPLLEAAGARTVTVVQDGVEVAQFAGADGSAIRAEHAIPEDAFVVGVVGSATWNPRQQRCYGSELVDVLARVRDPALRAILVGDGSGLPHLRAAAVQAGVADRMVFAGRVPYERLPKWLAAMDVCVSTQTNDVPGQVRTTGKLPIYLAAGRCVLATDVGEASLVLDPDALIPYDGADDPGYPARLAERVRALMGDRDRVAALARRNVARARERFEYDVLARRLVAVLDDVLRRRRARH